MRPQRDLAADWHAVANLEAGHRNAGLALHGLLSADLGEIAHRALEDLAVGQSFAHTHIDGDLDDAWHGHGIGLTELFHELRHDFLSVEFLQPSHIRYPKLRRWT
jgi:hypothetical protein